MRMNLFRDQECPSFLGKAQLREKSQCVCEHHALINRNFSEYYWSKIISKYFKIKDHSNCMLIS